MLSIDFGNSYTKIGFRKDENTKSVPLRSTDLSLDDYNICVPTLAATRFRNGRATWLYGTQVLAESTDAEMQVHRNWKPNFFRDGHAPRSAPEPEPVAVGATNEPHGRPSPWHSLSSLQLIEFIGSGVLTPEQLREAASILRDRELGREQPVCLATAAPAVAEAGKASRGLMGWLRRPEPAAAPDPTPAEPEIDAKEIGRGFFDWLLGFVEPICQVMEYGNPREIPVRITVPSFGVPSEQARLLLEEILQETGWRLDRTRPVLSEPVANLIGAISDGRNAVWQPDKPKFRRHPNYATMFNGTILGDKPPANDSPIYWIMIADVGGYTADFAMVGYDLETLEIATAGDDGQGRLLRDRSMPIGVHELDRRIREVLNPESREAFDRIMNDPDGSLLEGYHRQVYQSLKMFMVRGVRINHDAREKARIKDCIQGFADEVAGFAEHFRDLHQFDHVDELILTGGGCNIPQVRDAIRKTIEPFHLKNTYIPWGDTQAPPPQCRRLSGLLVRGATALGGASVFFDYPM